ncbi:MAG: ATP-binding cassette domain-containing protein, partial [Actinobacteria bacterium]|nr:ATP-binding cassette domain-containing protein [Actinomycetota bacterium]
MVEGVVTSRGLEVDLTVRRSDVFQLTLNLEIPAGETVTLLGPNGAGKSTAVAAIAGLLPID